MKSLLPLLSVIILSCWGSSCEQVKQKFTDPKPPEGAQADNLPTTDNSKSADSDERVDPPQNIIGHYLYCAVEKEPTEGNAEALVGCRLGKSEAQRTPAALLGSSYHFSPGNVPVNRVVAYSKDLAQDKRYDALFVFVGPTPQLVLEGARGTLIKVRIKDSKATGGDVLVGSTFGDAERSPSSFPEASSTDYAQARNEIMTEAQKSGAPLPTP